VQAATVSSGARHGDAAWRRRANRPLPSRKQALVASKRPSGLIQRRFIGTLAKGAQVGTARACTVMTKSRITRLPSAGFRAGQCRLRGPERPHGGPGRVGGFPAAARTILHHAVAAHKIGRRDRERV
jgi:hypothetical protein